MKRALVVLPALAVLLVVASCAALLVGSTVSPVDTLDALFDGGDELTRGVLVELRVPRVLVGLGVGAALGLAGTVLQAVLRNPLASPEVTGVGSGAVLGAVAGTVFLGIADQPETLTVVAVLGGVLGGASLWLVAAKSDPLRLAVLGVLVSAVLAGASLVLLTARPQLAGAAARWLVGSLSGRTWEHWDGLWPWLLVVVLAAVILAPALDLLAVDDDHARSVGLAVVPWRLSALGVAVLATAAAVAAAGTVSFVGLLAPHAVRRVLGAEHRWLLPASALTGAACVVGADFVAQALTSLIPSVSSQRIGVPTGAVTALVGAVVLVVVARRASRAPVEGGAR